MSGDHKTSGSLIYLVMAVGYHNTLKFEVVGYYHMRCLKTDILWVHGPQTYLMLSLFEREVYQWSRMVFRLYDGKNRVWGNARVIQKLMDIFNMAPQHIMTL